MTTHTRLADHSTLWRVLMVTPSGYVEVVEVRAPNEAMALDTVRSWKPCHQVAMDPRGHPLIRSAGPPWAGIGGRVSGVVEQVRPVGRPRAPQKGATSLKGKLASAALMLRRPAAGS
jgi:hypothetical protein